MKIAFIVNGFPTLSETFILNQITGLIDLGQEVEILAQYNPNEGKRHQDIEKYRLMEKVTYLTPPCNRIIRILKAISLISVNFPKAPLKILRALNFFSYGKNALSLNLLYKTVPFIEKKFDIIHCHFGTNGLFGMFLKKAGVAGKYLTSFHGYDVNCYPQTAGGDVYKELFKNGDIFTANTNFIKNKVVELGCDGEKITILPVGVNTEKFKFCEKKNKEGESVNILTVGRLVEEKGHEYAIRAIAKAVKKYPQIRYTVAGDGPLKEKLKSLTAESGLEKNVFFTGLADESEVLNLYEKAHIFILPSIIGENGATEGQGLVLLEAQSSGIPVIASSIGGIPETLSRDNSAFLVPQKDVDAIAEKIEFLVENPAIRAQSGKSGRKFVEENYDIKSLNKRLLNIYESIL